MSLEVHLCGRLVIDDHLRGLGIRDIEKIELGALAWHRRGKLDRQDGARLDCLARIRNALAHRKPAPAEDLDLALKADLPHR